MAAEGQRTPSRRLRERRRVPLRKQLFPEAAPEVKAVETWSEEENKALLEYVLFHCPDTSVWPSHGKGSKFWKEAAEFVLKRCQAATKRTAGACRYRMLGKIQKQFETPAEADRHFFGRGGDHSDRDSNQSEESPMSTEVATSIQQPQVVDVGTQTEEVVVLARDVDSQLAAQLLGRFPGEEQLAAIADLLYKLAVTSYHINIPHDFLQLTLSAAQHLQRCGRSNVVYQLAQAVGRMRPDGTDSRLPAKRMPMGLLEHMLHFFNADNYQKIGQCPLDYRQWLITMYCQFGNKWSNLHSGPMWSVYHGDSTHETSSCDLMDARVNVPGISARSIRKYIAASPTSATAKIQEHVLDEAARHQPDSWWWLKADGCDLVSGLAESTRGIWSGDVDLDDGDLERQYKKYGDRLQSIRDLKMKDVSDRTGLCSQLDGHKKQLEQDLEFLHTSLQKAQTSYEEKVRSGTKVPEKTLFKLAWQVEELEVLMKDVRKLVVTIDTTKDHAQDTHCDPVKENIAAKLGSIRNDLTEAVKKLARHQRQAATHIFVFMISAESGCQKPYALPVQCLPIAGLKDQLARDLGNKVITAMVERNMKVAGFTTNGEFNSLRWKGNTRPLTVLQVRSEARSKYQRKGLSTLLNMLTPVVATDGTIGAKKANPAVSVELLTEIQTWKTEGATDLDVITRLRQRTVPDGHRYHYWCPGKTETPLEMLKSILAQLHYRYEILQWEEKGIPFRSHAYVPEIHPVTGLPFHEREDEAHVFKRIAQSLRDGGPRELHLERFMEAVYDDGAKLSYHALIGSRKQSVSDVEQIFSSRVLAFLEGKGYTTEAEYVKLIRNWRRACDERGLTDSQRKQYNQEFLKYILDELMPWHLQSQPRDFSLLEVNQEVGNIRGFTRETLSALLVNIESREWRRQFNCENGIPPEHPRASTTDDVECFFSVLRDMVGRDFTHKEVMFGWRKACVELTKRLDPELPYYYHTSTHQRFYEGDLPDFSEPAERQRRERVARRELLTSNVGGRVTLAQRGASSIRTQYHNVAVDLPPPPSMPTHLAEHSYAS